ncbi:hypothetical protein [Pedobacter cryophilus]|uniref:Uncharacterized protein n=1 Tax=Pedobacter cryophilus TaxID=2571271 RepID=A0A4V5NXS2_9SPHI|nr:hypothetical protein [Pedobacter cryophilus]TKC00541.1 hypothetical protein FA046_02345 [Pedobacter cryophilus]
MYIISYDARTHEKITESNVVIKRAADGNVVFKSTYTVNVGLTAYKLASHESIINQAEIVKETYQNEIENIKILFEDFGKTLVNDPRLDHTLQIIQSVFYHNSIINTAYRSIIEETDCGCTPHPAYILDKKGFWCQEDYMINPEQLLTAIKDFNYKIQDREIKAFEYLKSHRKESSISLDKISNLIEPREQFMNRINSAYYSNSNNYIKQNSIKIECTSQGSDLGCCGNYSGCCIYWSLVCLEHDLYCLKCDHWYCGPQCKPL